MHNACDLKQLLPNTVSVDNHAHGCNIKDKQNGASAGTGTC